MMWQAARTWTPRPSARSKIAPSEPHPSRTTQAREGWRNGRGRRHSSAMTADVDGTSAGDGFGSGVDPAAPGYASPQELTKALADVGYLADEGLATAGYLAIRLGRPLF